ncbi:MAG: repressor LexA [Chloroflexi bacterium]|nr:MAG: repressor LexA [Anaerolineaceae bacterium 4572_32.2]RLC80281.1 MAG: repressor LexA [Chloroflexota bacterium]RLC85926.1 MAG: repressor LexA [Chloroflexota bacterium]HEY72070.1 repressor LexA [Thermoflexia bacterium]
MDEHLSERQQNILEFLAEYVEENGYPPSIREIGVAADISSTSVVSYNLERLQERGYVSREREVSRGLKLTSMAQAAIPGAVVQVPLLGRIVAGAPIPVPASDFPLMGDETIELTRDILGDPAGLYALEVEGNSMIDALVHDGDVVVMRHQQRVENGEMAAVWLRELGEMTLKRFYQETDGRVRLQPANPTMQPIYVDDPHMVEVQGKVVMVVRQLQ